MRKPVFGGFRPGLIQTRLYSHRRWLEALNFGFRYKRNCTAHVAKTKALISFAVTAKLICVFVLAYAKSRFSHDEAHMVSTGYIKLWIIYGNGKGNNLKILIPSIVMIYSFLDTQV